MLLIAGSGGVLQAEDIAIVKPGDYKVMISVAGFVTGGAPAETLFLETLKRDLHLSGWFRLTAVANEGLQLSGRTSVNGNTLTADLRVVHPGDGKRYLVERYSGTDTRGLAHEVADAIVWAVKRKPGIASSRILLVGAAKGQQDLFVCDADGQDVMRLTRDGAPCLAPSWGATGQRVYNTSMVRRYPDVYRIDLRTNRRDRIANFPGLNTGAVESPDGSMLALTLSRDGNPELYLRTVATGRLHRMTRTRAAEASPSWSPDGNQLVFVSDRSGRPQLYVVSRRGGDERRITYEGSENVSPDWGPDGRIAYSSRQGGRYQICTLTPGSGKPEQWTFDTADHEEPSWAPDGRHIAYAKTVSYRSAVYLLDTLKDPEVRLLLLEGDWYSPAWSRAK